MHRMSAKEYNAACNRKADAAAARHRRMTILRGSKVSGPAWRSDPPSAPLRKAPFKDDLPAAKPDARLGEQEL